jgi:riboflavin biosynthesis pyrimidine reductase
MRRCDDWAVRSLIPARDHDADVYAHYAADWVDVGGVRANFIASVDGAISAAGVSRGLQTPGDNRIFGALRDLADVVLVGSATAAAEGYEPVTLSASRTHRRAEYGLPDVLRTAVISGSLRVDPYSRLFADAATIVLTTASSDQEVRRQLVAEVVVCGDDALEIELAIAALHERGLNRVLCEGGPTLLASIAGAGALDELCLSLSPVLVGPGAGRLTSGASWDAPRTMELVGLLEEDGALFCRYRMTGRTMQS